MKKLSVIALCILFLAALAMPAMAAGITSFSMAASNSALHRGDTVTFTVTVSSSEPATSYGFQLSYDSAVLELVNGSCTVSGAMVSSFNQGFAFMFQSPTAYSGTVGTVTFRVKDNAAFGNSTISGTASVKNGSAPVDAAGSPKTIAISCVHSYGGWNKVSDSAHKRTCSICKKTETVNHTWNSGTVTKQPSCKEAGFKVFSCTGCNATWTEPIAKTSNHKYGSWTKVNDTAHKYTCSVCSKEETASHSWNNGSVIRQPSCKEAGAKTFTCTACNAIKTESVAKLTAHTYDHTCDAACNVCGLDRTISHNYNRAWNKDQASHWRECSVCMDKKDLAAHTPGAEAKETKAQTCTTCGYVIQAALGHKHSYTATWNTNAAGHWHACSGCEEKDSYTAHIFDNACDRDCAACGYTRAVAHAFAEAWTTDGDNHWHVCSGCGLKQDEAAHEPGAEATETTAQICTICDYEIAPALGAEETTEATADTDVTAHATPAEQHPSAERDIPAWMVVLAAIAVIGGGIIMLVVIKKR